MAYISKVTVDNSDYDISATKLKNARTIGIAFDGVYGGSATNFDGTNNAQIEVNTVPESVISIKHSTAQYSNISPVIGSYINSCNANRLAYFPNECFKFERSNNAGQTWSEYTVSEDESTKLTILSTSSVCNANVVGNQSVNNWHRITIDSQRPSNDSIQLYCVPDMICLYVSTSGATGCKCKIETCHDDNSEWVTLIDDVSIGGWSGWNTIPLTGMTSFGSYKQTENHIRYMRLTFSQTGINEKYASNLLIQTIVLLANTCYTCQEPLGYRNLIYSQHSNHNVTFPASVIADSFSTGSSTGTLTGTSTRSIGDQNGNNIIQTYAKKSDVPTITYTASTQTLNITT